MWKLGHEECWAPKNWCFWIVVLEKTLRNPLDCKEIKPVNPKGNQPWIFIGRTDAEAETPILWPPDAESTYWERPCYWERLRARGEEANRGWDGQMASLTQWTWVWANARRWWRTGKPGELQSMRLQRVRHDWATELNWPPQDNLKHTCSIYSFIHHASVSSDVKSIGKYSDAGKDWW